MDMDQQQEVKKGAVCKIKKLKNEDEEDDETLLDLRRGPWTVEEDFTLINYIAHHGEGRWNSLARCAGLKRTGKSCRLRWLNYLRPDVRRGNISLEEQLLILELHSRWGNRWSKIAQHLPGRTDNEIKNYWRTRVQKHAKQLKCDVNSKQFKDTMKYLWMPRLVERIQAAGAPPPPTPAPASASSTIFAHQSYMTPVSDAAVDSFGTPTVSDTDQSCHYSDYHQPFDDQVNNINNNCITTYQDHCYHPELVDHNHHQQIVSLSSCGDHHQSMNSGGININNIIGNNNYFNQGTDLILDHQWNMDGGDRTSSSDHSLWNNADDVWLLQHHQFSSNF